ncbi:RNA polymerase sigma factor [Candidatus Omnitrophota bacterium]
MAEDFRTILDTYQDRVYNQAYRMLGSSEDAEEATQDIFMKIYKSLENFRGESALSTWIYKITSNECISRLRKKQLDTSSLDESFEPDGKTLADIIPDNSPNPEKLFESEEAAKLIRAEVKNLPANWAMAISLFHFDDLSYDEISEAMDIPTATVATYISRGRKQLAGKFINFLK